MFDFWKRKKKETEEKNLASQISLGVNAENMARNSDAGREFVKAYTGIDGVKGQKLQKSLSGISSGKPNISAQKGYAAEVRDVAKRNVEEILKDSEIRYARVDDLPGHEINETLFDVMAVLPDGTEIPSLGSQMKFNQGAPAQVVDKLVGKEFMEKYPHAQYSVPKDRYDAIKQAMGDKEISLTQQLERAKADGNTSLEETLKVRLNYVKKAKENLIPSKVTYDESLDAVKAPLDMTVKDIAGLGHEVGVQYAQSSALINGTMTFARCTGKVIRGEMNSDDAVAEVAADTVKGAGIGYLTGQANTALASVMRNSTKEVIRELGKSSAPAQIVTFTVNVFRIVNDRMEGRITDEECFHNIAKSGIGIIGTSQAGSVGMAVGGPVGAVVASLVAGVVVDTAYNYTVQMLKAPGIARQERIMIEKQCALLHNELEAYREEFRNTYIANTDQLTAIFGTSLKNMALALEMNDADSFIGGANTITKALGGKTQFETVDEFADFLDSDEAFNL